MSSKAISERMGGLFSDDPEVLKPYERNTLGLIKKIAGVFFPVSIDDVVKIVKLANELNLKLYPISAGKNWGYGDTCPVMDNSMIVDLSKMNKILHFDHDLGVVTLEPGVTVQQLTDFLREQHANFICPINNAGPRTSIVGNVLEKGISISGPTVEMLRSIEAVLPSGEIYKNSLWSEHVHNIALGYRWGVGPYLDGLFVQGSFGIVTAMTIALPSLFKQGGVFTIPINDWDDLEKVMASANSINQTIGKNYFFTLHLSNHYSFLKEVKSTFLANRIISPETQLLVTCWMGSGNKYLHQAFKKIIMNTYKKNGVAFKFFELKKFSVWERLFDRVSWIRTLLPKLAWRYAFIKVIAGIFRGEANESRLGSLYQNANLALRNPLQPERDGLGIIWFTTIVLPKAQFIKSFYELANSVCPEFNFDPAVVMYSANHTSLLGTIPIIFDLNKSEQASAADKCYQALFVEGKKKGFYPSRVPVSQMQRIIDKEQVYWKSVTCLKNAMDPKNIISSQRYS